jgi:Fur family ferric uptake transcriptional regulator
MLRPLSTCEPVAVQAVRNKAAGTIISVRTPLADDLIARLKDEGLRATTQRRVIVETLLAQPDHVTAEDLTNLVQRSYPEVHLATVYRTLEVLESVGALSRLSVGHGPTQWHLTERSHQHLICVDCGEVEEVSDPAFARLAATLARAHGFQADMRHVAINGRCARCVATGVSEPTSAARAATSQTAGTV